MKGKGRRTPVERRGKVDRVVANQSLLLGGYTITYGPPPMHSVEFLFFQYLLQMKNRTLITAQI
jgi:hypothetical protein